MQQQTQLSKLMYLSWEIQKTKKHSRSKALQAAWAITQHADITVHYLVKRYSTKTQSKSQAEKLTLFSAH